MPGGQNIGEGYLSRGMDSIGGLLGPKATGQSDYGGANDVSYEDSETLINPTNQADIQSNIGVLIPEIGENMAKPNARPTMSDFERVQWYIENNWKPDETINKGIWNMWQAKRGN